MFRIAANVVGTSLAHLGVPSFAQCLEKLPPYPNYKALVPKTPSLEQFEQAWRKVFGVNPADCFIIARERNGREASFTVQTSTKIIEHGGFGLHTEKPELWPWQTYFYSGRGAPWDYDLSGLRYHLIDRKTSMPVDLDHVLAVETIRRGFGRYGHSIPTSP